MQPLSRLAQSLDEVVGLAASRYEWRERLGDEWQATERFLKPRGSIVAMLPCPSPGGEGCPRHVVRLGPEHFRAVCGNTPRECDTLEFALADLEVLAVDARAFATEIANALDVDLDYRERRGVIHLGRHLIAAGNGFPVALVLGSAALRPALHLYDFGDAAGAILMSSRTSIDPGLQDLLRLKGHRILLLAEVVGDVGHLAPAAPPASLFRELRSQVHEAPSHPHPQWSLPPGTRWEDLQFDLWSLEHLTVTAGGASQRLEPEHLGLRSQKNAKPTIGWILLVMLFLGGGRIAQGALAQAPLRQLNLLNAALRESLRLEGNPIVLDREERTYVPRFRAESHVPKRQIENSGTTLDRLRKYFRELPQGVG